MRKMMFVRALSCSVSFFCFVAFGLIYLPAFAQDAVPSNPSPTNDEKLSISSGAAAGLITNKVAPVYPPIAKAARVQGTVVLDALLSKTGHIESLHVLSGPAMLQQAAMDAVKNWTYRPYLMNGEPVEVRTTVNVIFTLGDPPVPAAAVQADQAPSVMPTDPKELMLLAAKTNGLALDGVEPWHLKATFKVFDDDGKVTDEGTMEEFWANETKRKCTISGKSFTQTYYKTQTGIFRTGEMNQELYLLWQAESEFVHPIPFSEKAIENISLVLQKREMGSAELLCLTLEDSHKKALGGFMDPAYCVDADLPILRIGSHQGDPHQFVHNNAFMFQGRYLPGDVEAANGKRVALIAHVDRIESIKTVVESDFIPSPDAVLQKPAKSFEVVPAWSGGMDWMANWHDFHPINRPKPEYPPIAKAAHVHGTVALQAVIGTDGHISYLKAISGPAMLQQAALDAVWKWTFEPYTRQGMPTVIMTTIEVSF